MVVYVLRLRQSNSLTLYNILRAPEERRFVYILGYDIPNGFVAESNAELGRHTPVKKYCINSTARAQFVVHVMVWTS